MSLYLVFDVESVGLHGEGFAVGGVVIDHTGAELDSFQHGCHPGAVWGPSDDDREWVRRNVKAPRDLRTGQEVRDAFWERWEAAHEAGITLVADCPWPVEAGFLDACIDDDVQRMGHGPYPFIDVASVLLAKGRDPAATYARLPNELPIHNPLADARQSARLFIEAMQ